MHINQKSTSLILISAFILSYSTIALAQANNPFIESKTTNNTMTDDFITTLQVNQPAKTTFDAINNVRGWWSEEIEGSTDKLNAEFKYHYQDVHRCKMEIIELVPNKKVVWLVKENHFKFTKDQTEWVGTKVIFELSEKDGITTIKFTHKGLVPQYECYEICRDAWTNYIQKSLHDLITTETGHPNGKDKPQTADEKKLAERGNN